MNKVIFNFHSWHVTRHSPELSSLRVLHIPADAAQVLNLATVKCDDTFHPVSLQYPEEGGTYFYAIHADTSEFLTILSFQQKRGLWWKPQCPSARYRL